MKSQASYMLHHLVTKPSLSLPLSLSPNVLRNEILIERKKKAAQFRGHTDEVITCGLHARFFFYFASCKSTCDKWRAACKLSIHLYCFPCCRAGFRQFGIPGSSPQSLPGLFGLIMNGCGLFRQHFASLSAQISLPSFVSTHIRPRREPAQYQP